jgi:hypothetical protein
VNDIGFVPSCVVEDADGVTGRNGSPEAIGGMSLEVSRSISGRFANVEFMLV